MRSVAATGARSIDRPPEDTCSTAHASLLMAPWAWALPRDGTARGIWRPQARQCKSRFVYAYRTTPLRQALPGAPSCCSIDAAVAPDGIHDAAGRLRRAQGLAGLEAGTRQLRNRQPDATASGAVALVFCVHEKARPCRCRARTLFMLLFCLAPALIRCGGANCMYTNKLIARARNRTPRLAFSAHPRARAPGRVCRSEA
jgi:hypothetical protein